MGGECSEADLAACLCSLRETPRGVVPPSGPGESSTHFFLPKFPLKIHYIAVTNHRTLSIRLVPTPEPMTFPGHPDDEVSFYVFSLFFWFASVCNNFLAFFQVVLVMMDDLKSLFSRA